MTSKKQIIFKMNNLEKSMKELRKDIDEHYEPKKGCGIVLATGKIFSDVYNIDDNLNCGDTWCGKQHLCDKCDKIDKPTKDITIEDPYSDIKITLCENGWTSIKRPGQEAISLGKYPNVNWMIIERALEIVREKGK